MKKIISLVLVLVLALTAIGGTLAYFTDTDEAENVFTVGNIDIRLDENHSTSEWEGTEDYEKWLEEQEIMPGISVDKVVNVSNIGSQAAFVRVIITIPADMTPVWQTNWESEWNWSEVVNADGSKTHTFQRKEALAANAETGNLLLAVQLNADVTELNALDNYIVPVNVEAIQAAGLNYEQAFTELNNKTNIMDTKVVTVDDAKYALANLTEDTVLEMTAGSYELPNSVNGASFIAAEGEEVKISLPKSEGDWNRLNTNGSVFNGITFTTPVVLTGDATFINCVFEQGTDTMTANGNVTFRNCEFNANGKGFSLHVDSGDGSGILAVDTCTFNAGAVAVKGFESASFNNCTFAGDYSWKYMRTYMPTTLTDCTFACAESAAIAIGTGGSVTLNNVEYGYVATP